MRLAVEDAGPRWYAVDVNGLDLLTGRPPRGRGAPDPVTALLRAPVASWPLTVRDATGAAVAAARALGPGGPAVAGLLDALESDADPSLQPGGDGALPPGGDGALPPAVADLTRQTPLGPAPGALRRLDVVEAAAATLESGWLAALDDARTECRRRAVATGWGAELEAALHLVALVATARLDPPDDEDVAAHVASGAQLWLLAAATASALAAARDPASALAGARDPFAAWGRLAATGWWPVGPVGGELVVAATGRPPTSGRQGGPGR